MPWVHHHDFFFVALTTHRLASSSFSREDGEEKEQNGFAPFFSLVLLFFFLSRCTPLDPGMEMDMWTTEGWWSHTYTQGVKGGWLEENDVNKPLNLTHGARLPPSTPAAIGQIKVLSGCFVESPPIS